MVHSEASFSSYHTYTITSCFFFLRHLAEIAKHGSFKRGKTKCVLRMRKQNNHSLFVNLNILSDSFGQTLIVFHVRAGMFLIG